MEDSIVERVIVLMEYYALTASAFADKIDVQRSSMSHLVSGRNKPSLDFIQKVLNNFSDINPTWLIMGTGPMKQLDIFDIKGDVAPVEPIPAAKFQSAGNGSVSVVAEQTVIRQDFQEPDPFIHEPVRVVYTQAAPAVVSVVPEPVTQQNQPPILQQPVMEPVLPINNPAATVNPVAAPSIPVAAAPPASIIMPDTDSLTEKCVQNDKKVTKIVFFYSDNTFETFNPH